LYAFLVQHFQITCQDPDQPFAHWPDEPIHQPAFSPMFIQELRDRNRRRLLAFDDAAGEKDPSERVGKEELREKRRRAMKKVEKRCPSADDLFQIAGAHVGPHQRVLACMRMAGISKTTIVSTLGLSKFTDFIQGRDPDYTPLPNICAFLCVDLEWVKGGPKRLNLIFDNGRSPWWLHPWRTACFEAASVFTEAERRMLLPWQEDRYDFLWFWSAWNANPMKFPFADPPAVTMQPLTYRTDSRSTARTTKASKPTQQSVPVTQAVDPIPSLLPWLFSCRNGFNTGDPTFSVKLTSETLRTLGWIVNHYHLNLMGTQLTGTLPLGPAPTEDDVCDAMQRLFTGGESNLEAATGDRTVTLTPPYVPAPAQLPSDANRPMPGPRPGSGTKGQDGAPSAS
jgi:hypothetical protein